MKINNLIKRKSITWMLGAMIMMPLVSCGSHQNKNQKSMKTHNERYQTATLGGGCFWCIEAIYLEVKGVISVTSGYSGGKIKNPTYREVSSGMTSHAEVVQIVFDPGIITFRDILTIFFHVHDPTTLNRQGADIGTQYRSVIYYHDDDQKFIAEAVMQETEAEKIWPDPLVTELSPYTTFYKAENYHQDYYANNQDAPYCTYVISPKMEKFRKNHREWLRK